MPEDTRLPLATPDPAADLVAQLRAAAPQVFSEGRVDFEKLRTALGESVDSGPERYGLAWAGKSDAFRNVQAPSVGTLLPMPEESVNWDSTENLIIEGDNLEVLKLLQKSYHGKVKMIYIDPPYNTGNDFVYRDDYRQGLEQYLRYSGQITEEGTKQSTNTDTSGRFHSDWLSMMYPRLFLARNLLREDGVIFVSIDDNEVHNLRMLMNEVFGEGNFIAQMVWEGANKNTADQIGTNHEYVLLFARNRTSVPKTWKLSKEGVEAVLREVTRLKKQHGDNFDAASDGLAAWFRSMKSTPSFALRRFRYIDKIGAYKEDDPTAPGGRKIRLIDPRTNQEIPLRANRGWAFDQDEFNKLVNEGRISFITPTSIMVRRYLHETDSATPQSVFYQPARSASERLDKLLGGSYFPYPKDEVVIRQFVEMATDINDADCIVLDFFAGSGTTAQAVLELNGEDGGNRKFVLVQLPEATGNDKYQTIPEITRERAKQVISRLRDSDSATKSSGGFRAFKLSSSNFKVWNSEKTSDDPATLAEQLKLYADNVEKTRTQEDMLYELVLKNGLPLSSKVERIEAGKKPVWSISDGKYLIYLENTVSHEVLRAMLALKPERMMCLDAAFAGDDALKTNIVLEAKSQGVAFHTV